ncbi:MAG: acyltransferase family protein [Clostridia bacterium]|nr:acyltransferase family protein [Clostridia bacterium]
MLFKERAKRETGFELLRIIAMFLIGAVHVMNYGGMLKNGLPQTIKWQRLIYAVFTVAVNVFVLISAYFMVKSKLKPKKLIYLWLQVVAYSVGSYVILCLFSNANFSLYEFAKCWLPVLFNKYWFFTAYFLLMLVSPFLNKILHSSSKKELYTLNIFLIVLAYLGMKFPISAIVNYSAGYSFFGFAFYILWQERLGCILFI